MGQTAITVERLMTCTEVDRTFRLQHGAARKAAHSGLIRCAKRERGGHTFYLISPSDAFEKWGPK